MAHLKYCKTCLKRFISLLIVVHSLSCVLFFVTSWTAACQASEVFHYLLEFAQTHVHWVDDAIQPSHPLLPPSPALSLCQHRGLFQSLGSSRKVAKVLELQLQYQSFQWIFKADFLWDWLVWSPCCLRESQESSPTPQFESITSSVLCLHYGPILTSVCGYWENHSFDYTDLCWQNNVSAF